LNQLGIKFLTLKETGLYGFLAFLGSMISSSLGGWTPELTLMVILMGADYVTGIFASLREGRGITSSISFWGLLKKGLMMLAVLIGYQVDSVMNTQVVMTGCIYFWYANEIISLTENYGRLGLPMPEVIKKKIAVLKSKSDENLTENNHELRN